MRVWITKYALTAGVYEAEAEDIKDGETMISVKAARAWAMSQYFHKGEWQESREAAMHRAEQMRVARIASLRKSIAKLEKLSFEVAQ